MPDHFSFISSALAQWYEANKRSLPWRETKDPYFIWISEVILQQTRVAQGYDYYKRFTKQFPDVNSLANASEDIVMKLWQGLGYYSRARNLHFASKTIQSEYKGMFPSEYEKIRSLKGVGEYTAAAIASFAFDLPYAVVDGNVSRFLSRLFAIDIPINTLQGKKVFTEFADKLLDSKNPGLHNQAIMEFGALQCTPVSPNCEICVFNERCLAFANNEVNKYPQKQGKTTVKERFFNYFDIRHGESIFLSKRESDDIWKSLYELPLIETDVNLSFEDLQKSVDFRNLVFEAGKITIKSTNYSFKHVLSHRVIYARFYRIEIENDTHIKKKYIETHIQNLSSYAIPRLVDRYFESINEPDLFT